MSEILSFMLTAFSMVIVLGIPLMCGMLLLYYTFELLLSIFEGIQDLINWLGDKLCNKK